MYVAVDIGNSRTKILILKDFDFSKTEHFFLIDNDSVLPKKVLDLVPQSHVILSSVRETQPQWIDTLKNHSLSFFFLNQNTPLPIINLYKQKETLGLDRIAAACGAKTLFPSQNCLIIDMGTAITFDIVTKQGEFLGGNISTGAKTRLQALNQFTGKLPLISSHTLKEISKFSIGTNTKEAIINGVAQGITFEINGYIHQTKKILNDDSLTTILTGGDAIYFENMIKNTTFAIEKLVLIGLLAILKHNIEKK